MVIILLKLTRVNPDRNIFSINVELTNIYFFTLKRFGPSPSPNVKYIYIVVIPRYETVDYVDGVREGPGLEVGVDGERFVDILIN